MATRPSAWTFAVKVIPNLIILCAFQYLRISAIWIAFDKSLDRNRSLWGILPLTEFESKVLLALRDNGLPIMSLPKMSGISGSAVYNAVRVLLEKRLVSEERETKLPRRRFIKLTSSGRRVAGLLNQIEPEL